MQTRLSAHLSKNLSFWLILGVWSFCLNVFSYSENNFLTAQDELKLLESNQIEYLNMLGQRLIDPPHWREGIKKSNWPIADMFIEPIKTQYQPQLPAYLGYGEKCFANWKSATQYYLKNSNRFPTIEDYLQIHRLSFYNEPGDMFWGYYRYQIWKDPDPIQRQLKFSLLEKAQKSITQLQELFNLGIQNGRGVLRTEGDSSWSGKPWSIEHNRSMLYSVPEFENLKRHPLLRPEVLNIFADGIDAKFWHPPGAQVEALLKELFKKTTINAQLLKQNKNTLPKSIYLKNASLIAAEFYIQLLVIHGLWDGVGRSSKLMRDWVLRYLDLYPPLHTPTHDMEMSFEEYAVQLEKDIIKSGQYYNQLHHINQTKMLKPSSCSSIFGIN